MLRPATIRRGLAALALFAGLASPARAQRPFGSFDSTSEPREERNLEAKAPSNVTGPVDDSTYVLGPGDVLEIHFSGAMSQDIPVVVGPEGSGFVRGYGTAKLGGLTLLAARNELRRMIAGDLRHAMHIDVQLIRVRNLRVFPAGEVTSVAPIELPATGRASEALGTEKLLGPLASRRNVELRHRDGTREPADLDRYVRLGDLHANPLLRDDDVLFVPPVSAWIEASGAVAHPTRLELGARDSLRDLLRLAGGALSSARREQALFLRFTTATRRESMWVSLDDVESGRFNPPLHDADQLFVYYLPEFHRLESASIFGEVTSPGVYPLQPGVTKVSDLVHAAGGFQPRADLSAIRVYRPRPDANEPDLELDRLSRLSRNDMTNSEYEVLRSRLTKRREDFRVDWNRLARAPAEDVLLVNGDVVRVDPLVNSVRVEGQVVRPGLLSYEPGASLYHYVKAAGGYSGRAKIGHTLITRAVTGQTLPANEVANIEPGDMIWVPERSDRTIWQELAILITVAAQVATIYIAFRR
jgi:protein involved in polysaccharide export with SLBB domain